MFRKMVLIFFVLSFFIYEETFAQILPSSDLLSPGLAKWTKTVENADTVRLFVSGSVDDLFHIRDLSVLKTILSLVSIDCLTGQVDGHDVTNIELLSEEEGISKIAYLLEDDTLFFSLDGVEYSIHLSELGISSSEIFELFDTSNIRSMLTASSWIERLDMPILSEQLTSGELFQMISGFQPGDMEVIASYSDDGKRLTRLALDGNFYFHNELWSIKGDLFKPGGDSPKDTANFHIQKDDKNTLDLALSSKYSIEKRTKDRSGVVNGNCRISITGRIDGFELEYIFGLKVRNDWNADGTQLSEKITVTPSINWTDKRPELKNNHFNSGSLSSKNVIKITSEDESEFISGGTDSVSIKMNMDGETVFSGTLDINFSSEQEHLFIPRQENMIKMDTFNYLVDEYTKNIGRKIFDYVGEKTKKKIVQGL